MGKTFEQHGETYIVSENVDNLDTESLVDKSTLQKVLDRVEKSIKLTDDTATDKEKSEQKESVKQINITFFFGHAEEQLFSITGILEEFHFGETAKYQFLVSVTDFLKIPLQLQGKKSLFVNGILISWKDYMTNNEETMFRRIKSFSGQKLESRWVRCCLEIST